MKRIPKPIRYAILTIMTLAAISIVIIAARRAWPQLSSETAPLMVRIEPRDFTVKIAANGELQSAQATAIGVPFVPVQRLRIASVVTDGSRVNKGDLLVEFDPTELDLEMLEHRSSLESANQKISKGDLAVGVEKTDIIKDKKIAELELAKIREFLPRDEKIYSRRQIIEGQLDQEFTEQKLVFAEGRLQIKGKIYTLDEAILLLERQQANNKIGQVESALTSLRLVSPAAGIIVYNTPDFFIGGNTIQPGRTVWIGQNLFNLVNPEKMEAKCFVLEKDAGELHQGQSVTVTLDPFPGIEFTGKVKNIDTLARPIDRDSPVKYFQTIVSLDKTDPNLMKPGVKLKAQICAGELKSVVVIPRSALVKKDSDQVVYINPAPGKFEAVKVKLGQGDLIQVVVTDGLKPGQMLALNPPDIKRETASGATKTATTTTTEGSKGK